MHSELFNKIHYYLLEWDLLIIPPLWIFLHVVGILAGIHALLNKQDPRAALGWTAVCIGIPGIGAFFYILFGVNRIKTRAKTWYARGKWGKVVRSSPQEAAIDRKLENTFKNNHALLSLIEISDNITELPLVAGCQVHPLYNGEEAYPQILKAIHGAQDYIFLSTYIFETNFTGREFVEALAQARARGVEVHVLVDGIGARYSRPRITKLLKQQNIPHVLFLPISLSKNNIHLNLRTHRKIIVVDGKIGFTGGMNIGDRHLVDLPKNKNPTQDIHFKFEGPIVEQLQQAFLTDWNFAKGSPIEKDLHVEKREMGPALCRGIIAGPNEELEKITLIVQGAISSAKESIKIMTPYFIPDMAMIAIMHTAALRGVKIEIILPEENNLAYLKWASQAFMEDLLRYRIRMYYQPPPFAHSKLLLVDDFFSLVGSANMDPRSLVLNFEFNVEVFDHELNQKLKNHFDDIRDQFHRITLKEIEKRPFRTKLRDSVAKLFSPYL